MAATWFLILAIVAARLIGNGAEPIATLAMIALFWQLTRRIV